MAYRWPAAGSPFPPQPCVLPPPPLGWAGPAGMHAAHMAYRCLTPDNTGSTWAAQAPSYAPQPPDAAATAADAAPPTLELSDELVAAFARMEQRRGRRKPQARAPTDRRIELPQQENEATRAVMAERALQREDQDRAYGARASTMRMLEADLNSAFDSISHDELPVLWPSVPLRAA